MSGTVHHLETQMWRATWGSVQGVSHLQSGQPCQDFCATEQHGELLLSVMSDGAGSAEQAEAASQLCVMQTLNWLRERLGLATEPKQQTKEPLSQSDGLNLLEHLRQKLHSAAQDKGVPIRELACTLSVLVLAKDWGWSLQIGDGAAVLRRDNGPLGLIFAPDTGEYANQTYFVTDVTSDKVHCQELHGDFADAALLTDGLQQIALLISGKVPYAPFFAPIFEAMRHNSNAKAFALDLERFLYSPNVSERVDDDKTLMIISKVG